MNSNEPCVFSSWRGEPEEMMQVRGFSATVHRSLWAERLSRLASRVARECQPTSGTREWPTPPRRTMLLLARAPPDPIICQLGRFVAQTTTIETAAGSRDCHRHEPSCEGAWESQGSGRSYECPPMRVFEAQAPVRLLQSISTRSAAAATSSCSQMFTFNQPRASSSWSFRRARARFSPILASHHSALFFGREKC